MSLKSWGFIINSKVEELIVAIIQNEDNKFFIEEFN